MLKLAQTFFVKSRVVIEYQMPLVVDLIFLFQIKACVLAVTRASEIIFQLKENLLRNRMCKQLWLHNNQPSKADMQMW
jgi:hypothetical protein